MSGAQPRLLLVRHGRTEWNRLGRVQGTTDVPLDSLGRAQADRLASALAHRTIAGIFSSPLARARETAERIRAEHRHRPSLVLLDELRELDYGRCQGLTPAQWATVDPDLERRWRTEPWRVRFPQGETLAELRRRADDAMARLRDRTFDPDAETLVVAHGHILRALLLQLCGLPAERFWTIDIPNASILTVYDGEHIGIRFEPDVHCGEARLADSAIRKHVNERAG